MRTSALWSMKKVLFGLFRLYLMELENEDADFGMDGLVGGTGCRIVIGIVGLCEK